MSNFATYSDLEARLGITMTAAEQTRATALLTTSSDLVRQAAGQDIDRVTDDVHTQPGIAGDRLRLPQRPVISVASITATSETDVVTAVDEDTWYLDGDELVRTFFPIGFTENAGGWFGPAYVLTITYTHGDVAVPALAKAIAVESAARAWNNPEGALAAAVAGGQFQFGAVGMLLTKDEERQIAKAFRRTAGSVNLR